MTTTPTSGAADRAIESCPELNMGNYDEVDVERLNDWAIRANDEIDRLHALAAVQATEAPQGVAYADAHGAIMGAAYDFRDAHISGSPNQKRSAHAALESAVTHALRASHGQAPATQQAGATKEHVRLVRVIADKIEDGTLFRSGIYSNKDLARFVRNVADAAAPQFPTTQAQADSVQEDAARYRWLAANCRSTSEHWGGRWSIVIEGPAPKSHNSEDDFDAAVDAARKQGEKQ